MEQEYYEINKKTVDKGWAAMREMLDQEMPVPEKRRRRLGFFWLWLLLGFGVMAGAGFAFFSGETSGQPAVLPEKPVSPNKPVAVAEPKLDSPESQSQNLKNDGLSKTAISENQVQRESQSVDYQKLATKKDVSKNDENGRIPNGQTLNGWPMVGQNLAAAENSEISVSVLGKPAQGDRAANSDSPVLINSNLCAASQQEVSKIEAYVSKPSLNQISEHIQFPEASCPSPLPGKSSQAFENQAVVPKLERLAFQEFNPIPRAMRKHPFGKGNPFGRKKPAEQWQFGLNAGLASQDLPKPETFFGGAVLDWQPFEKFGLRTGLNYRFSKFNTATSEVQVVSLDGLTYFRNTGDSSIVAEVYNSFEPVTTTDTFNPDSLIASTEILLPVTQKQNLEMPILVFFQPFKSWRLYGGLTVSRLLAAKSGNQKLTDLKNNSTVSVGDQSKVLASNLLIQNELPKWFADASFGIGWNWKHKTEVSVSVRMPLKSRLAAKIRETPDFISLPQTLQEVEFYRNWRPISVQISGAYFF